MHWILAAFFNEHNSHPNFYWNWKIVEQKHNRSYVYLTFQYCPLQLIISSYIEIYNFTAGKLPYQESPALYFILWWTLSYYWFTENYKMCTVILLVTKATK